ncbi:MAG TPA: hypothetical protein VN788_16830 [Verrucomicrobiae bacterium]|nr:hypothetical protein [Verrucomicrobiae bacterium]
MKAPSSIPGQFIILAGQDEVHLGPNPLRDGWTRYEVGAFRVFAAPEVPVIRCKNADGSTFGIFLGEPLNLEESRFLSGDELFGQLPPGGAEIAQWIEKHVYRLAGRYIFVLSTRDVHRVYLDVDGFLPLVYDPSLRIAGATAGAIYDSNQYLSSFDSELFEALNLLNGGWFPAGLTAHHGLRRLMCNFYLDLESWTASRHWPTGGIEAADDAHSTLKRISASTQRTLVTYLEQRSCCMALTGGNESRLLLSLARSNAQSIPFICWYDKQGARDAEISENLAAKFGLNLTFLGFPSVTEDEATEWLARIGYCATENRYRYKVSARLSGFDCMIGGLGGEIGRGFFWRRGDENRSLTPRDIYKRLALPPHPRAASAVDSWFQTLPTCEPLLQLDLAYLEVRMSCWAAVQAYGGIGPRQVYPLVSREVYSQMLALPPSWRRNNRWVTEIIGRHWPDLLAVPINNLGPLREAARLAARVARKPSLIVRRWRRRFA